jgi:hypothetical protein
MVRKPDGLVCGNQFIPKNLMQEYSTFKVHIEEVFKEEA